MQAPDDMKPISSHHTPIMEVALATWLRLAAAPAFSVLAGLSLVYPSAGSVCISTPSALPFHDMGLMYLLMGMVHLPPWLMLIGRGLEREASEQKDC